LALLNTLTLPLPHFFFQSYGAPRDLHSFPTRRSSDLWSSPRWSIPMTAPVEEIPRTSNPPSTLLLPNAETVLTTRSLTASSALRSEEHTSELQSLTNLVCRLLLEKKKKISQQSHSATQ